jgi:dTDP-4-dehydrorhamnose reductase
MRFLLFGGSGQVGTELRTLAVRQRVDLVAPSHDEIDLMDALAIESLLASEPWSGVINAAAYTNVDDAEREPSVAYAVNAEAPTRLAAQTARRNIPLIHISTDYVFDGRKGRPYVESDETAPLNVYGSSKLASEHGVTSNNPQHIILRTSWVYSPFGRNFVKTIVRLAAERDRLTVVADQRGCPTAAVDVARACLDIAAHCAEGNGSYGLYHFAGAGDASWFELAKAVIDLTIFEDRKSPLIIPIRTADYPTAAKRPADTRLDCTAISRAFGIRSQPWQQALAETIGRLSAVGDIQ